ncbi:MAG: class I tRNA ligase family protein, partial [Polyangiaceae bacterium]|nr:class I tRNA ligase family protein [Polyangiaceae bacterium]
FGADALRMTLATFAPSVKRIALAPKRIEGYRFFANKMWNATRFSMEHTGNVDAKALAFGAAPKSNAFYNQWILSRLSRTTDIALNAIDEVRLDEAVLELYRFFWTDLCDWFLELGKIAFQTESDWKDLGGITTKAHVDETRATLVFVLEQSFRLIHPFMPYVTEELWQRLVFPNSALGTSGKTIALEKYPSPADFVRNEALEQDMDLLQKTITGIRGIRGEYDLKSEQVVVSLRTADPRNLALIESNRAAIAKLCRADLRFEKPGAERAAGTVSGVVPSDRGPIEIHIHLKGIVTKDKELDRIARETKRIEKELATIQKKLNSPGFVDRAPPEVVAESKTQELSMVDALSRLKDAAKLVDEL